MPTKFQGTRRQELCLNAFIALSRAAEGVANRIQAISPAGRERGLTPGQLGVLEAVYFLGPMNQQQLAKKILRSGGNLTMVIDHLERDGLVQRTRSVIDRRANVISLTPSGQKVISQVFPGHVESIETVFKHLSGTELEQLRLLCKKAGLGSTESDSKQGGTL